MGVSSSNNSQQSCRSSSREDEFTEMVPSSMGVSSLNNSSRDNDLVTSMGVISSSQNRQQSCRSSSRDDEFTDLVLSMSVDEILYQDLYKYKVKKIPQQFESVDEYFPSFVYPLLEETRAQLAAALEAIYKAPNAEVSKLTVSRPDSLLYTVSTCNWRIGSSDGGKDPYKILPGDVLLLSNLIPETGMDLRRIGSKYTFVAVQRIDEGLEAGAINSFTIKASKEIDVKDYSRRCLYVVYLTNVITNKRIWNALHKRENLNVIKNVLSENQFDQEDCEFCPRISRYIQMETGFGAKLLSNLNESQNRAISTSLQRLECCHRSSVDLIWGPPGTGKTKTLSVLLYILLKMNIRTLVSAPTNVAITELATRVVQLVRDSFRAECEGSVLPCPLTDILIFGNKDKLKIGLEIEDIFLDSLVDGLGNYKYRLASMIDFLKNVSVQYQSEVEKSNPKSFLEFAREQFKHTKLPFRRSILAFLTRVPRSSLVDQVFQSLNQILSLLDSFESVLFDENMESELLENAFSREQIECGSESLEDYAVLMSIRSQCLSLLKYLQSSPANNIPLVNDEAKIVEFCFEKSLLIFCTTSSSFKLLSTKMKPFELLVFDEAAQAKECESLIPLQVPHIRHAILVGDERQLPATVGSKLAEEAGFGRSLFERLSTLGHFKHLLNMQYRMHPSILSFPNSIFYGNQIRNAPNVQHASYGKNYLQEKMFGPYSFINVPGGEEQLDDIGHSRRNMVEVAVILNLVQKLSKGWHGTKEKLSIGVISPYAAQVAAIRNKLKAKFKILENLTIKVKSVDGFQGGEQDIIIISTVRANKGGSIGFLSSPQRTNVALTRARHCLWIIGNATTLIKSDSVWGALVNEAKYRQCFYTAGDDPEMAKAVLAIKKELDQLEDMLNGDSELFKKERWTVQFSDDFKKSFESLRPSHLKKLVTNLLLKLASGWRPRKINVDSKCESSQHLVKQFKVEDHFVICSIDVIREDPETNIYKQVLKVWDVLPKVKIPKLLDRLDKIFKMLTIEFTALCNEKCFEGPLEVPVSWLMEDLIRFKNQNTSESSSDACPSSDCEGYVENSRVSESLLLMKFYSLSTSVVQHLLTDHEGKDVDLPFEVTDEERRSIIFPRTSFIIGRSGTGKTTVLTMKLCRSLQQFYFASGERVASDRSNVSGECKVTNLHQLFVTVSPKLCYAVKQHVNQLKRFAIQDISTEDSVSEMDDLEEVVEFKDIPDSFIGIQPEKYPLIITFHKFIMMLNGSIGNSYFDRFREARDSSESEATATRSVALQTFLRKNEVTFDRFSSLYWPHFNSDMTKNLEPSRVFVEIMSHIKGGLREGENCYSKLSRHQYGSLSESRVSTLSAQQREVIYDIYLHYEKKKLERREFDPADLVNDIHVRLNNENLFGDKMDFVYIDEVQDLTMRQIALFRYICTNIDEGFTFSGDTAQTIARGIDFRFEDIKSLFYNEFLMKSNNCISRGRSQESRAVNSFHLSHNFRTHVGVLRLAQSVIDLICHFFPLSIDKLAPETSPIYGEPPILLEPGSDENAIVTIFGNSGRAGQRWIGFGADQVILVRDDLARKEIMKYVGSQAIVLTIVECKGLEFQDVLLYNFFGSSPLGNKWRVLYEYLKERDLLDNSLLDSFPSFDESKHYLMCSELKQLYVAITRTRQRLWICEKNEDISKPIFDYWRRLSLVQVRDVDDSIAEAMQSASSPEEWRTQGKKLFWERNYEMAMMCFEKAGDEIWEKQAKASSIRATADRLRDTNLVESRAMLTTAAEIFESIGKTDTAAECFCDLGEYQKAGRIYLEQCGMSGLSKAGECFMLARCYKIAAEVYYKGNLFTQCLSACTQGKYFDMGLQFIENWRQKASDSDLTTQVDKIDKIAQDFLESCALQCHRTKKNASMLKFVRAFHDMESMRNFLRSLDCLEDLIILEDEFGNFDAAAEIAKTIGNVPLEADLLGKGAKYLEGSSLIISYVLCNSLWVSGNQGWPLKSFPQKDELLSKAKFLAMEVSESFCASICNEVQILSSGERSLCEFIQIYISSKHCERYVSEILSVKGLLEAQLLVEPSKYQWEHEFPSGGERYFEETIMSNKVSRRTLVRAWSLHKEHILLILDCLDSLERHEHDKCEGVMEFCFSYFGIRLSDNSSYQLMNSTAEWVKIVDQRFVRRHRNVTFLDARHFVLAARKYWQEELQTDGFRVLEKLQALYRRAENHGLPKFILSTYLADIYDIAKCFMESKSIAIYRFNSKRLEECMRLSMKYFSFVFPLDPRESLSEELISFRQSQTSKNLLEEYMSRDLETRSVLSHGQIGRAIMIWLGSGKPRHEYYQKMIERTNDNLWQSFIEFLWITELPKESDSIDLANECLALSQAFHVAIESTYFADWRTSDYISPNCFLYLVERLLILVPHSGGFFCTTKSSLVEWLISDTNPRSRLISDESDVTEGIFDFLANVIQQFIYNIPETVQWIENSGIKGEYYFPIFMLRLIMIQCLLCLNSEMPFNGLLKLIGQGKLHLPPTFCEAIRLSWKEDNVILNAVAKAFAVVKDPVVMVAVEENKFVLECCPDAIFLTPKLFSCKKDVMDLLFPRSVDGNSVAGDSSELPHDVKIQCKETIAEDGSILSPDTASLLENLKKWEFQGLADMLGSAGTWTGDSGNTQSLKVVVDEHVQLLVSAISEFTNTKQRPDSDEDASNVSIAFQMITDMEQLSSLLDKSNHDNSDLSEMQELLTKLQSRMPELVKFYDVFANENVSTDSNDLDASTSRYVSGETISGESSACVQAESVASCVTKDITEAFNSSHGSVETIENSSASVSRPREEVSKHGGGGQGKSNRKKKNKKGGRKGKNKR